MNYKRNQILVPVNFNSSSTKGIEIAADIAGKWGSELTFIHVIDIPEYAELDTQIRTDYLKAVKRTVEHEIENLKNKYIQRHISISTTVRIGKSAPEILKYVKEQGVRLIVLGSKKYTSMEELLEGSSVERVVRYADCPVLSVKESGDIIAVEDIVFATDLRPTGTFISRELKELQKIAGATLHVVKVNTRDSWMSDKEGQKEFDVFNKVHQFDDFKFLNINAESVEEGILNYADNVGAGMIAMSTHTLYKMPVELNNHFITERVMQGSPKLLWTCVPSESY